MPTVEFIIELFCRIDDRLHDLPKHPQAHLYPSEIVTLAVLFALKGGGARPFYRWLSRDYRALFPRLPERTRLFRLFATHQRWADRFLAEPTTLGVADTYGIELLHPWRERRGSAERRARRLGRKGLSNHRWIIGGKLGLVLNQWGLVCAWGADTANVHDSAFQPLVARFAEAMVVLVDHTFGRAGANPANMKVCPRGTWNDRMAVETTFSMLTLVCHLKKVAHRAWRYFTMRLGFVMATFNLLVQWDGDLPREDPGYVHRSLAQFSL
jgi:hypothetical protein